MTTVDVREARWRAEDVVPLRPSRRLVGDRLGNRVLHALAGSGAASRRRARSAFTFLLGLLIAALCLFLVALFLPPGTPNREEPSREPTGTIAPVPEPIPAPAPVDSLSPTAPPQPEMRPETAPPVPEAPTELPFEREGDAPPPPAPEAREPERTAPSEIITESVPLPPSIPVPKFETQEILPAPKPVRPRTRTPEPRPRFELPASLRPSS